MMGSVRDDVFFCKQKTAYELRSSDWSSDVCSSDLRARPAAGDQHHARRLRHRRGGGLRAAAAAAPARPAHRRAARHPLRSEEHTSELQSLMRISYAVFCLKKKRQSYIIERMSRPVEHVSNAYIVYYSNETTS